MYSDLVVTCLYSCVEESGLSASRSIDTYLKHAKRVLAQIKVPKVCFAEPGEIAQKVRDTGWFEEVVEWDFSNSWLSEDDRLGRYQKIVGTKVQWLEEAAKLFSSKRLMWVDFGLGRGVEDSTHADDDYGWTPYEVTLPNDVTVPQGRRLKVDSNQVWVFCNQAPIFDDPLTQFAYYAHTEPTTKSQPNSTMRSFGMRPVKTGVFLVGVEAVSSLFDIYKRLYNYLIVQIVPTPQASLPEVRYKLVEEVVLSCMLSIKEVDNHFDMLAHRGGRLPAIDALFYSGVIYEEEA